MNKIVVDPQAKARMNDLAEELELYDEDGRTLGYFIPATERERDVYAWAKQEFTDEEIQHMRAESGALTIDELLEDLKDQ